MVEQKIEVKIKNKSENLGVLTITSTINGYHSERFNGIEPKKVKGMHFEHIEEDYSLDTKTPIQYCVLPSYSTNIFLLEETEYTFSFVANKKVKEEDIIVFDYLKKHNHGKSNIRFAPSFNNVWIVNVNFRGFAGKSFIDIIYGNFKFSLMVEVRTKKLNYDTEYSEMIADLSKISSGLLFNINASLYQNHILSNDLKSSLYEYFMLLEYLFRPQNLPAVCEYLSRNLYYLLENTSELVPTALASNIGANEIAELSSNPRHVSKTAEEYSIYSEGDNYYIPLMINEMKYMDNIDIPENRFFKYFLEFIRDLISNLYNNCDENQIKLSLEYYSDVINSILSHRYFNDISRLDYIPLNSQVLQKKEGYREILQYYLMFEFGLKISFDDLTDKFRGFEKELGKIYEIWSYFQLIDIINDITDSQYDINTFVTETNNKWSLSLLNINELNHFNSYFIDDHEVKLTLMYEKGFSRPESYDPNEFSSYSSYLNPDYTVAIECDNIKKLLHFDAKYKIDENGSYKDQDIHKMHTYKDGINNTIGAYVLFPGEKIKIGEEEKFSKIFDEIDGSFGSVGAFCLKPGQSDKYKKEIKNSIKKIIKESIRKGIFTYEFESQGL